MTSLRLGSSTFTRVKLVQPLPAQCAPEGEEAGGVTPRAALLSPGSAAVPLLSCCLNFRSIVRDEKKLFFTESFANTTLLGEESFFFSFFLGMKTMVNVPIPVAKRTVS